MATVKNRLRLNNQDYEIVITLYNTQGLAFPINPAGIASLIIEESTLNWFKRGYIVLENNENVIERRPNEFFDKNANYKFRNDGRDLLTVSIKPVVESKDSVLSNQDPFTSDLW